MEGNNKKRRTVIVTGATGGIGGAVIRALDNESFNIVAVGRNEDRLRKLAKTVKRAGFITAQADVRNEEEVIAVIKSAVREFNSLDAVVNSAGVFITGDSLNFSTADFNKTLDVNVRGTWLFSKHAIKEMIDEGRQGIIINISSGAGTHGLAGGAAYSSSKFAVIGLSESLDMEFREKGIRVMCILPGKVNTSMQSLPPDDPARKIMLQPEDIADLVVYLMSLPERVTINRVSIRPALL